MTGFNLPPGCNVSDIPGNRPEDQAAEAFAEAMSEQLPPGMADEDAEKLIEWAWAQMGDAYGRGYREGIIDQAMAEEEDS